MNSSANRWHMNKSSDAFLGAVVDFRIFNCFLSIQPTCKLCFAFSIKNRFHCNFRESRDFQALRRNPKKCSITKRSEGKCPLKFKFVEIISCAHERMCANCRRHHQLIDFDSSETIVELQQQPNEKVANILFSSILYVCESLWSEKHSQNVVVHFVFKIQLFASA